MPPAGGRRIGRYWMVQWSGGGGIGHYAWLLADALACHGVDVVLATRRTPELLGMPQAHAIAGFWPDAPAAGAFLRRARILRHVLVGWTRLTAAVLGRRGRGDVVHLQNPSRLGELPFLLALRLSGATILATAHNVVPHDSGLRARLTMRVLYRIPHGIVAHTEEALTRVRALAGPGPALLVLRHPSFAPLADHFGSAPPPAGDDPLLVASLGTIRPYKGLDRVLDVVGTVREFHPDTTLSVVGRAASAHEVAAVLAPLSWVRADLGYASMARLVDEARRADVVLLGHRSTSESGIAHLALGSGAVVIGPRMAAIERLVAPEPGWTYDPDDAQDATRVLAAALDEIRRDRPGMRRRARSVADAVPAWSEQATAILALVHRLR